MRGPVTDFWGKLEKDDADRVVQWHPLSAHCADVAACAELLLRTTVLGARFATLAGLETLSEQAIQRYSVLAALHDLGKFNHGFQRKALVKPQDTAGHVTEFAAAFGHGSETAQRLMAALPCEALASWTPNGDVLRLLLAAVGHHGKPVLLENAGLHFDAQLWTVQGDRDPVKGIAALVSRVKQWYPLAFEPGADLPAGPPLQHAFAGLVMLADWLGSDRDAFPYAENLDERIAFAREQAARLFGAFGLDPRAARGALGKETPGFDAVSEHQPRRAQVATLALPLTRGPSLTILESETGSGKTEAALARFVQLFHTGTVDGMTFALPTRTSAIQIHRRIVQAVERAFPNEEARPPVVLAVPGYLQVDEITGRRLPGFEVLWNDRDKDRWRFRGWAGENSKRYLAGAITVGTIDQVLLSALQVGHAHLRRTALLRHLLVVDEVHASDVYMTTVLEEVLRFHGAAGGSAFLMSATLGCETRAKLEAAMFSRAVVKPSLAEALRTAYPALHHLAPDASPAASPENAEGEDDKVVLVRLEPMAAEPEAIAALALDKARRGARVLILRNTVKDATATQLALEALAAGDDIDLFLCVGKTPVPHHSRYAREDRIQLDEAIEARLGKLAPQRGGFVGVATQTVQQSLDLDADFMITDLAPMDVLLQRFGRVHRHSQRDPFRPAGARQPSALVLCGKEPLENAIKKHGEARGSHGVGSVYPNVLILEATRRLLAERGQLAIPSQNRELVELTVHSRALEQLVKELGGRWEIHKQAAFGQDCADIGVAALNRVQDTQFGDFGFGSKGEKVSTRLGENNYRVMFSDRLPSPLSGTFTELNISQWMLGGATPEPLLEPIVGAAGQSERGPCVRFTFAERGFVYTRLGLEVGST